MAFKAVIKGLGTIENFYLNAQELRNIGQLKHCNKCNHDFIIGEKEVEKAHFDYKGNPKTRLEYYVEPKNEKDDGIRTIEIAQIPEQHLSLTEKAILFGVETVHMYFCPACSGEILSSEDTGLDTFSKGRADRRFSE